MSECLRVLHPASRLELAESGDEYGRRVARTEIGARSQMYQLGGAVANQNLRGGHAQLCRQSFAQCRAFRIRVRCEVHGTHRLRHAGRTRPSGLMLALKSSTSSGRRPRERSSAMFVPPCTGRVTVGLVFCSAPSFPIDSKRFHVRGNALNFLQAY